MKTLCLFGMLTGLLLAGAVVVPAAEPVKLDAKVHDAVQSFQDMNPKVKRLFDTCYGYAVFPSIGKGAIGIGVAEGRGQVFEKHSLIGEAKMTQVTVGAQLGGQSYSEVIFFETKAVLDDFKDGKTTLAAGVSAVAAADGVTADAKYRQGVQVYTLNRNGLMFQASVGGQHFTFTPLATATSKSSTAARAQGLTSPIEPTPQPVEVP